MNIKKTFSPFFLLVAFSALFFFLLTSGYGIGTEDSAELAGGARLLTMVHAPGYPLYLIVGRLASALSEIPGKGLVYLSVFSATLTVIFLFLFLRTEYSESAAAVASFTLLFCQGFCESAVQVEVYAISLLLIILLLGILFRFGAGTEQPKKLSSFFGFALGLTLAHHMGILILLPVIFLYLFFISKEKKSVCWLDIFLFALPGISFYFVLMILSTRQNLPVIGWPPIKDFSELINVASGASFKKLLFAVPIEKAIANMLLFPLQILSWFPLAGIILSAIGIVISLRKNLKFSLLLLAVIIITIIHASNYKVLDPEAFLLPAALPAAWFAAPGFQFLIDKAKLTAKAQAVLVIAFFIIAFSGRIFSGGIMTSAMNSLPIDVSRVVLNSHASDSEPALIWADWRYYPTLRYFQIVEGLGGNATIELDTTSKTPGVSWREGRTYAMSPSFELGEKYALIMENMQWRVADKFIFDSEPRYRVSSDTALLNLGGIDILKVEYPDTIRVGSAFDVEISFTRNNKAASDTILGEVVIMFNKSPRISVPFAPWLWHFKPSSLAQDRIYLEKVQALIPSAHKSQLDIINPSITLRLETSDSKVWSGIGELKVKK
ncbi:MAG: hypothetical protein COS94_10850 [Candidatus Hydrogenedentes bacterium CG07_land_8_20_14_0_80_42_17]|nr:MAG: hypothetical protein COS94_10850 [Candidatus Hydrogenedentes bacterium CG07_land_8_20_14_0_80_42_17]